MQTLSEDFDAYAEHLTRRNTLTVAILVASTVGAALMAILYFITITNGSHTIAYLMSFLPASLRQAPVINQVVQPNLDPLHLAAVGANIAVLAALRIWYTQQEKMTALLTHALVLQGEQETAIRVLLHKDM